MWNLGYAFSHIMAYFPFAKEVPAKLFFLNRNAGEGHVGVLWLTLLVKGTLIVRSAKGGDTMKGSTGGSQRDEAQM